jgi:hypothetical protein
MNLLIALCLVVAAATAPATAPSTRPGGEIVPPARRDVPGKRIQLATGELFVPDFFRASPADDTADVVVWFLGAPWCAQQVFYDAGRNAVLVSIDSRVLQRGFHDPADWRRVLDEAANALSTAGVCRGGVGKVVLCSFSGGWTGVRDVLARDDLAKSVADVVLLDSLYARDKSTNQIDQTSIAPFLRFAKRAVAGETTFVFTHLYPPEERYRDNTTTRCAAYLIEQLGLERKSATGTNSRGAKLLYRADRQNFHVLGYAGMTNQDHFDHFYAAADALKLTTLAPAAPAAPAASTRLGSLRRGS